MSSSSDSESPIPDVGDEAAAIEQLAQDLDGVERALERLEDGTYWADEVTGEPLPDDLIAEDPTARRNSSPSDPTGR